MIFKFKKSLGSVVMLKGVMNQGLFKHSFCSMREQESRLVKMAVLALETGKKRILLSRRFVIYQQTVEV